MNLVEATRLYQAALEELRADPTDEELEQLVGRARREMEIVWLRGNL